MIDAMAPIQCLWIPGSPRALLFTQAVQKPADTTLVGHSWAEVLETGDCEVKDRNAWFRIDSPGRDWEVERALLKRGALLAADERYASAPEERVATWVEDPGRIWPSRQHFLGFRDALSTLRASLDEKEVKWMQDPQEISIMCDKHAARERMAAAGVRIPHGLGLIDGFDHLVSLMEETRLNRVFLKLCHGSSASGAVAIALGSGRIRAYSTSTMERSAEGDTFLRNSRSPIEWNGLSEIRRLVDAVCRHRAIGEAWVPKAGWEDRRFDVRIVVIGGRARQVVARLSKTPFTNLQLGATRRSAEELRERIGFQAFVSMCEEAERAMTCFPGSLHGGVDLVLSTGNQGPRVIEVNAFGDLLPSVRHEGLETYGWELKVIAERDAQVSATGR
jgi:glutathione synthase/RimK-type ligase-like ATP-grasp enzyme